MDYQIKIENFEGPMDLLLFFIQRDRLNIYDIPIAHITSEFLGYVNMMDTMNIELGGEFVYMASLLMKIKVQMLLPLSDNDNEEIEDPRTPLVQRLLEYQQFKDMGDHLGEKYNEHLTHYPKGHEIVYDKSSRKRDKLLQNVNLFSLASIFQELIQKLPDVNPYELRHEPINLDEQIAFLEGQFKMDDRLLFHHLMPHMKTRLCIVVTFMAILEMLRTNQIAIEQNQPFGELTLVRILAA